MTKLRWPAPERNKEPILEVLRQVLPSSGRVLEIASGTGQHAAHFARALPNVVWQPTDPSPENLASIAAWVREEGLPNLAAPRALDVEASDWGIDRVDAVFCANMIHIAPWSCTRALLAGAARVLPAGAPLVLYGPFREDGVPTAPSNETFDADLRARNPAWGLRALGEVVREAEAVGLAFDERVAMPANNLAVVFRRVAD
jgi:SAM-dependent methyltransferase